MAVSSNEMLCFLQLKTERTAMTPVRRSRMFRLFWRIRSRALLPSSKPEEHGDLNITVIYTCSIINPWPLIWGLSQRLQEHQEVKHQINRVDIWAHPQSTSKMTLHLFTWFAFFVLLAWKSQWALWRSVRNAWVIMCIRNVLITTCS